MVDGESKTTKPNPLRVGWLTTANGPGSRGMFESVLHAIESNYLNVKIDFVFINRDRGQTAPTDSFIDLATANHIPTVTLSSLKFRRQYNNEHWDNLRYAFDKAVLSKLQPFSPDISVMAGYMLYAPEISRQMLILNQHPALPGETIGTWQNAIWDVIQNNANRHGAMIHIATPELDRGPVLTTCSFSVRGTIFDPLWEDANSYDIASLRNSGDESLPLFIAVRQAGIKREQPLVVETLKAIADGDIDLANIANRRRIEPIDMTDRVDLAIARNQT